MSILSRHLLARFVFLFVAILCLSTLAVSVIEVMLNFEEIFARFEGLRGILSYLFLRIPSYYLRELVPVTSFAAAFFCIGLAARAREVTAAKTGGISPHHMALPILLAATGLSACALVVNETFVLHASREWSRLENPGEEITFRRGSFWYHRGNVIYNVREADRVAQTLHGVRVFELTESGRLFRSTRADLVEIHDGSRWRFVEATSRTFDPEAPSAAPLIEQVGDRVFDVAEGHDIALLDAGARHLSLPELFEYVGAQRRSGRDTARFRSMLHFRLSEPLTVLLFALLAVPLGFAVEQTRSVASCALRGIALIGAFYLLRTGTAMFSAGSVMPAVTPWLLLGAFATYGALRLRRVPT